ncbi:hypothetical protein V6N13_147924 [Hibiscus sabdariffa]
MEEAKGAEWSCEICLAHYYCSCLVEHLVGPKSTKEIGENLSIGKQSKPPRSPKRGMARGGIITLYVGNLPEKLHWCGLRQAFGRHGDLVDSYIAKKLDRQGKRFGFVRYSNMRDARRAMERLNGFKLFGFRLVVFLTRYNVRTSYWKKNKVVPQSLNQSRAEGIEENNDAIEIQKLEEAGKAAVNGNDGGCKKISGFVDNETLWMLGKCLVGTMAKDCSTKEVEERLHQWGLGDTLVKRLGRRDYLLKLMDEELLQVLEKQE